MNTLPGDRGFLMEFLCIWDLNTNIHLFTTEPFDFLIPFRNISGVEWQTIMAQLPALLLQICCLALGWAIHMFPRFPGSQNPNLFKMPYFVDGDAR